MSTSVASVVSHFPDAENGFTTTTSGSVSSGAATVGLNSVAGYTNGQPAVFVIDPTDAVKKQTFTGIIDTSGVQVTSVVWTAGSNTSHASGATVVDYATATHIAMISKGILVQHAQDGTHTSITAGGTLGVTGATTLTGALTIKSYDGWITPTDTWTYASATTFTIAGVDRTAQFPAGTKLKLTQTTAKYFYVTASAFSTNTTITVTGGTDYTLANAAITSPNLSYMETPQSHPIWFAYTPTATNITIGSGGGAATTGSFRVQGKDVIGRFSSILGTSGQSVGGAVSFTTPVTSIAYRAEEALGWGSIYDSSGTASYSAVPTYKDTGSLFIRAPGSSGNGVLNQGTSSTVPITFAASDEFAVHFRYRLA